MAKQRNAFVQYFVDIWDGIVSTAKGMGLTLGYFFKKPVTMQYPEERPVIPETHRGKHEFEEDKCMLCMACANACPVSCIVIEALGKGKERLITKFDVDYSKCLFCNLCTEACKFGCIYLGKEYDMAVTNRAGCLLELARGKSPEEIEQFKQLLAQKEAERKAKQEALKKEQAAAQPPGANPAAPVKSEENKQ